MTFAPSSSSPLRRTTPFVYGTLSLCALVAAHGAPARSLFASLMVMIAGCMFANACGSYAELRGRSWLSGAVPSLATMLFALSAYAIR